MEELLFSHRTSFPEPLGCVLSHFVPFFRVRQITSTDKALSVVDRRHLSA